MASAAICSSATTPRVYASTTQSTWSSDSSPPSRLVRITSMASNPSAMLRFFPSGEVAASTSAIGEGVTAVITRRVPGSPGWKAS
jgi:hypothetical protein